MALGLAAGLLCGRTPAGPPTRPASQPVKLTKHLQVDLAKRQIIIEAAVSERREALEFLLCQKGTKDYESLLVTELKPSSLHAALLMLNVSPGLPARWSTKPGEKPVFLPPSGAMLEIAVRWKDAKGNTCTAPATDWMLSVGTKKKAEPMRWVFVGSGILDSGGYWADADGHHISLANFASSVIDVPFRSSDQTAFLEFVPNGPAIPAKGTPVDVVIAPVKGAEKAPAARVTFAVDQLGRIELDGRPIAPEDIAKAVKEFLAQHAQGAAEAIIDPRAMVFDRDRLKAILEDAGMTDVTFRTRALTEEILPRTADQAAKAIAWWKRQFADAGNALVDPAQDARETLKLIERRKNQLDALSVLWSDYAAQLRELLDKHRAAPKAGDNPAGQDQP